MKKYILSFLLATCTLLSAFASDALINAEDLNKEIQSGTSLRVLDVRSFSKYKRTHIENAAHTDYSKWREQRGGIVGLLPPEAKIQELIQKAGIDADSHVVIVSGISDTDDFGKAARVYWTLKLARIENVSILNGGFTSWQKKNYRVSRVANPPRKTNYKIGSYDRTLFADASDIQKALQDDSVLIVDARPKSFFDGFKKHPVARTGGTIPNAVNLSQFDLLEKDGTLVSKQKATALFAEINKNNAETLISFCNTGHWAATNWFVFSEYLGKTTALYDGSFVEWSQDKSNAVANARTRKELNDYKVSQ